MKTLSRHIKFKYLDFDPEDVAGFEDEFTFFDEMDESVNKHYLPHLATINYRFLEKAYHGEVLRGMVPALQAIEANI